MLQYKEIDLEDREWIDPILKMSDNASEEYSFTFMYIWRNVFGYRVARLEDFLIVKSEKTGRAPLYFFPAGKGDKAKMLEVLEDDAKQSGHNLIFSVVLEKDKEYLEAEYPGKFSFRSLDDYFDYVYSAQSLITLAGKKLHSKRNHINRFKDMYPDWSYEPITAENLDEVLQMNSEWLEMNMSESSPQTLVDESKAVSAAIKDFEGLKLSGGVIRVNGKPVAFSIGDILNSNTYLVHIEKAFGNIQGAYTMINKEFSGHNCQDFEYINREDDSGDEGLRKAKKSYYPAFMVKKYNAKLLD